MIPKCQHSDYHGAQTRDRVARALRDRQRIGAPLRVIARKQGPIERAFADRGNGLFRFDGKRTMRGRVLRTVVRVNAA